MNTEQEIFVAFDLGTSMIRGSLGVKDAHGNVSILFYEEEKALDAIRRGIVKNIAKVAFAVKTITQRLENSYNKYYRESLGELPENKEVERYVIKKAYVGLNGLGLCTSETVVKRNLNNNGEMITKEMMDTFHNEALESKVDNAEVFDIIPYRYIIDDEEESNPIGISASHIVVKYKLICGSKNMKSSIKQCFQDAGLDIVDYIVSPIALANVVAMPEDKELGSIIINFGAGTTSVSVYKDCKLCDAYVIPLGGNILTEDIRSELNLTLDWAEKLKKTKGSTMPDKVNNENIVFTMGNTESVVNSHLLSEIIEARIDEIFSTIDKRNKFGTIQNVIFTGGACKLNHIAEKIASTLGADPIFGSLCINVSAEDMNRNRDNTCLTQIYGLLSLCKENCLEQKKQEVETNKKKSTKPTLSSDSGIFNWAKNKFDGFVNRIEETK